MTVFLAGISTAQTNYSLSFDGVNDKVNLGIDAGNGLRSIECWFRPSVNYTDQITEPVSLVVRNTGQNEVGEFGLFISPWEGQEGHMAFSNNIGGVPHVIISDGAAWTAGQWYHIAGVIDPQTGMKLYIDGVLQADTNPSTGATQSRTELTTIGTWGDANIRYMKGELDEIRFWDRAITPGEILQNQCVFLDPAIETGLAAYYRTNEGSGITLLDISGNALNGAISGATYISGTYCQDLSADELVHGATLLTVFPNPFVETATVRLDNVLEGAVITVTNLNGQLVMPSLNVTGTEVVLQRSDLPAGVYLVRLQQQHTLLGTYRMVLAD